MTALGLMFLGLALVGYASSALDDSPDADRASDGKPDGLGALLFVLCLASVLSHAGKRSSSCDDDE